MSACFQPSELAAFLSDDLSPAERAKVQRHVDDCHKCRRELELLQVKDAQRANATVTLPAVSAGIDSPGDVPNIVHAPPPIAEHIEGYDILREIHRGGQGVVYKAIQKATKRTVALKVLLQGPYATAKQRHRFEREIDLVASLQHPNIVTIYDSGVTNGRHFFAMEYIHGQPLDAYLSAKTLSIENTLRLFQKICAAVNYAHQRGVIHRDLKPGNIRVNSTGEPHVLDFGLAKTAGTSMEGSSLVSVTGEFMGTLAYASPEQTRGDPNQIDIRTDVYSLGVILYEMLTGKYPYEVVGQMAGVLRNIAEAEPKRPSTIRRQVNDEVETIVLKALAKEKDRRYQSAENLAKDIEHYLTGEPIEAKRDSGWYVLRKALRRYRIPATIAAAFVVLVIVFGSTMAIMAQRNARLAESERLAKEAAIAARAEAVNARQAEEKQREVAESNQKKAQLEAENAMTQARRAEEIKKFLVDMLASINPWEKNSKGAEVTVRAVLDQAAKDLEARFQGEPAILADLQLTIARSYVGIGLRENAQSLFLSALKMYREIYGRDSLEAAEVLMDLAPISSSKELQPNPLEACREAIEIRTKKLGANHELTLESKFCESQILWTTDQSRNSDVARYTGDELVNDLSLGRGPTGNLAFLRFGIPLFLNVFEPDEFSPDIAKAIREVKRYWEAGDEKAAFEVIWDLKAKTHAEIGRLWKEGNHDAACEIIRRNSEPFLKKMSANKSLFAAAGNSFTPWLLGEGEDLDVVEPYALEGLKIVKAQHGEQSIEYAHALRWLAQVKLGRGDYEAAVPLIRQGLDIARPLLGYEHSDVVYASIILSDSLSKLKRFDEAEKELQNELTGLRRPSNPKWINIRNISWHLVGVYNSLGQTDKALALRREIVEYDRKIEKPGSSLRRFGLYSLIVTLRNGGRFADAEQLADELLKVDHEFAKDDHDSLREAEALTGGIFAAQRKFTEAEIHYRNALDITRREICPSWEVRVFNRKDDESRGQVRGVPDKKAWKRITSGEPLRKTTEIVLNHPYSLNPWAEGLPADHYLAAAKATVRLPAGRYFISTIADDGIRMWVDNRRLINEWKIRGITRDAASFEVEEGLHDLRIEYFEYIGPAQLTVHLYRNPASPSSIDGATCPTTVLLDALSKVAEVLNEQGKPTDAEPFVQECMQIAPKVLGETNAAQVWLLDLLKRLRKWNDADKVYRDIIAERRSHANDKPLELAEALGDLAKMYNSDCNLMEQYGFGAADPLFRECLDIRRKAKDVKPQLVADTAAQVGWNLKQWAWRTGEKSKHVEAEQFFREALDVQRKADGNEHENILHRLCDVGWNLVDQDRPAEAEKVMREALELSIKLHGKDKLGVVSQMDWVADTLRRQNKVNDAESMYRKALEIRRREEGAEHVDVAYALGTLSNLISQKGDLRSACELRREALGILRKRLGNEHFDVSTALINLAETLRYQWKLAEAEPLYREALDIRNKLRGEEHNDSLYARRLLGINLRCAKNFDEADAVLRKGVEIVKAHHEADQAQQIYNLWELAWVMRDRSNNGEAEKLLKEALKICHKERGAEHYDASTILIYLAWLYRAENRLAESESNYADAIKIRRKLLGGENGDVVNCLCEFAGFLSNNKKAPLEAEPLYREAMQIRTKLLGEDHRDTLQTMRDLAITLEHLAKYQEAEDLLRRVIDVQRKQEAQGPTTLPVNIWELARILFGTGRFDEAEKLLRESSDLLRQRKDEDQLRGVQQNYGLLLRGMGRVVEAESVHQEIIAVGKSRFGNDERPEVASAIAELASDFHAQGRLAEARELAEKAIAILKKSDPSHDHIVEEGTLSMIMLDQGLAKEAEPLLDKVFRATPALSPPFHWIADYREFLLGCCISDLQRFDEAEAILARICPTLLEDKAVWPLRKRFCAERMIRHYEAWGKSDNAAKYRRILETLPPLSTHSTTNPSANRDKE